MRYDQLASILGLAIVKVDVEVSILSSQKEVLLSISEQLYFLGVDQTDDFLPTLI